MRAAILGIAVCWLGLHLAESLEPTSCRCHCGHQCWAGSHSGHRSLLAGTLPTGHPHDLCSAALVGRSPRGESVPQVRLQFCWTTTSWPFTHSRILVIYACCPGGAPATASRHIITLSRAQHLNSSKHKNWEPCVVILRRMLPGLNAAAVGLITAAVFQLSFSVRANSPTPVASTCIGAEFQQEPCLPGGPFDFFELKCSLRGPCASPRCIAKMLRSTLTLEIKRAGIIGFCLVDFLAVPAPAAIGAGGLLGLAAWAAKLQ